jgi:hypothetical protein
LIGIDFNNKSLKNLGLELRPPLVVSPRVGLLDLLREFRKGKSHMAILTEQVSELQDKLGHYTNSFEKKVDFKEKFIKKASATVLGLITLEDVIEKMINLDILDEDDYERTRKKKTSKLSKKQINLDRIVSKELARSLLKDKCTELNSMVEESYKRSFFNKKPAYMHHDDTMHLSSKKEDYII